MSEYARRIAQLQEVMRAHGAKLAVLGDTDQMRYLTGWAEHGHERLVGLFVPDQGAPVFLVPALNAEQAKTNPAGVAQVVGWDDTTGWQRHAQTLLQNWNLNSDGLALIDNELHSGHLLDLQSLFPSLRYAPAREAMTRLREIKTTDEIAAMTAAARLIDAIYEKALGELREGMTENDLADCIRAEMKQNNTREAFSSLVCFGANTALPHHHADTTRLQHGDMVVIDIGCLANGYPSDITRTLAFGTPADPDAAKVYGIVSQAHWAARGKAVPGVSGEDVDAAAREVITGAGYGEQFIHRTGHGIGLSGHEPPDIVAGNREPLRPGMCFSIEPGIYLPGRFGVRIENIVTMTPDGARSLNAEAPRELLVV